MFSLYIYPSFPSTILREILSPSSSVSDRGDTKSTFTWFARAVALLALLCGVVLYAEINIPVVSYAQVVIFSNLTSLPPPFC